MRATIFALLLLAGCDRQERKAFDVVVHVLARQAMKKFVGRGYEPANGGQMRNIVVVVALCAAGCKEPLRNDPTLRVYAVPGRAAELRSALYGLFRDKPETRAELSPDGSLLVLAPPSIQRGVEEVVGELKTQKPDAPQAIRASYWFVLGRKGQAAVPPELGEVKAALDEAQKALGPQQFKLLERIDLASGAGEGAEVNGKVARVSQNFSARGSGGFRGHLTLHARERQNLTTTIDVEPGKVLVLAQSGVENGEGSLYYLVRADVGAGK